MKIATQNVHGLFTELEMRCWKQYLYEEDVDICGATETRMNVDREKKFHAVFKDDFHCVTKIRKNRKKNDFGSGGLALLVRKGSGTPRLAKESGSDEILWVEMEGLSQKVYIAVVYLVPVKSTRYKFNGAVRRELEVDIIKFRNRGTVVIMGDLNSRIGMANPREGVWRNNYRGNRDKKTNDNGREWIKLTSNTDMVTLTGLYGEADYTCFNVEGNSVVDHICVDRRSKGLVLGTHNRKGVMGRIDTDHSMVMVSLELKILSSSKEMMRVKSGPQQVKRNKIALNRIKKKKIWEKYREACEQHRGIMKTVRRLDEDPKKRSMERQWGAVRHMVVKLEELATRIAEKEGNIHLYHINKRITSNSEIAVMIERKTQAWSDLRKCRNEEEEKMYRRVYKNCKNVLNKARRRLRENHKREVIKEIESLGSSYPGVYWKLLKRLAGRKSRTISAGLTAIDEEGREVHGEAVKKVWSMAFEELGKERKEESRFDSKFEAEVREEVEEIGRTNRDRGDGDLNKKIRYEEVKSVIGRLCNGKAAGIDEIVNEVIKYGGEPTSLMIWQLIKNCFETEVIPQEWAEGIIFPIYKAGDGRNPENFRGISLLCIIGKIYTAVLHSRLSGWCESNGILAEEQGGFRPGRGCVDQLYVIVNIIRNRVGRKTYCCFIDLRKAYDRVWRTGLWKRLWDEGIRGKIWRVIKNLYDKTKSCVLVGGDRTDFFDVEIGVRQGCVLSPTLFSIYINGLAKEIAESGMGIEVGGRKIAILMYADDIVITTDSQADLMKGMEIATKWGRKWRCSYNQKKSQVVVFGQRKLKEVEWRLGGEQIDQVPNYKYLGLDLKGNLSWKKHRERLLSKARKNMTIAWAMGIQSGHLSVVAAKNVWKTLVRPIVEYVAEICGDVKWDGLEKLQRDMGKRILGLNVSTNNEVVLGELGWWTMKARRDALRLRFWRKLIGMHKDRLPKIVYEWELRRKTQNCWTAYTKKLLVELGLEEYWQNQMVEKSKSEWNTIVEDKIQESEQESWQKKMAERPKLCTYRKVKDKLEHEVYLNTCDKKGRRAMARLRSGTNSLRIETGRHEGLERKDRVCRFGCKVVEDEKHFLLECKMYKDYREELKANLGGMNFEERGLEVMLGKGDAEETKEAMKFIKRAEARRRRLLDIHGG